MEPILYTLLGVLLTLALFGLWRAKFSFAAQQRSEEQTSELHSP